MEIVFEVFGLNPCIPRFFLLLEQFLQDTSNEAKIFPTVNWRDKDEGVLNLKRWSSN